MYIAYVYAKHYPKTSNVHLSKYLSFISTIVCQELGYIWT